MKWEDEKTGKRRARAETPRDASKLSGASDETLLVNWSLAYALSSRARNQQSLRSHLFAHRLVAKCLKPFGSGAPRFLSEYFGARFSSTETARLAGEKFYRKTGRDARRTNEQARLNVALSLNIRPLTLASYPTLIRPSLTREAMTFHTEALRRETFRTQTAQGERTLVLSPHAARGSRELKESLTVHERVAREVFSKMKVETVRPQDVSAGRASQFAPVARSLPSRQSSISVTRHAQTLLRSQTKETLLRSETRQTQLVSGTPPLVAPRPTATGAPERGSMKQVYLSQQSNVSILSKVVSDTTAMRDRAEYLEKNYFNTIGREDRGGHAHSGRRFAASGALPMLRSNPLEFIRRALSVRGLLDAGSASGASGAFDAPAHTLISRSHMLTLPESGSTRSTGRPKATAAGHLPGQGLAGEQRQNLERVLVALRRETKLELPPVARVYAPPQRPVAEARSVVKQVEEKEVIETIKREVTTQMKSLSGLANFTRADFTSLTDHVYDALARRLLTERERLGLNS